MAAVTQSNDGNKAMADEDVSREGDGAEEPRKRPEPDRPEPESRPLQYQPKARAARPGFFTIYKKGQGYWTRMGTAIGAAFLGVMFSLELYRQLPTFLHGTPQHDTRVALIVALAFLVVYSAWAYWFTNKPSTVDFLVATDSEMKKVNWTTRKELIGSTKIVILFMLLTAVFLFSCDLLFGAFFHLTGVLKTWF